MSESLKSCGERKRRREAKAFVAKTIRDVRHRAKRNTAQNDAGIVSIDKHGQSGNVDFGFDEPFGDYSFLKIPPDFD